MRKNMLKDYFRIVMENILHRKIRSWLTMIGIFIGIAAVVSLVSLGQGLENVAAQRQRLRVQGVGMLGSGAGIG